MSLPYFFFRKKKRSDCKVRTLEAENFDEEDKSLVPAWLRTGGQRLPLHSSLASYCGCTVTLAVVPEGKRFAPTAYLLIHSLSA